jgi:hypothetical protein
MKKNSYTKITPIVLISIIFWYFFAYTIAEVLLLWFSFFSNNLSIPIFIGVQLLAIGISYRIIFDKRIEYTLPIRKWGSPPNILFILGTVGVMIYFSMQSLN